MSKTKATITSTEQTTAEKTALIVEQLIREKNKYTDIVESVFWLFNDTKDGQQFDAFVDLVARLKEYFFIPENSRAFCDGAGYHLNPKNVYQLFHKLDLFIEGVYNFQGHGMRVLDLFELTEHPGQIPDSRLNRMYHEYARDLEIKQAKEAIEAKYKSLIYP